jgi:hypothetical protein
MSDPNDKDVLDFEILKRYGAKWAVLAAMASDMRTKGIPIPHTILPALQTARGKIESGCFSPCEVDCVLAEVEGPLFSQGDRLDPKDFQQWSDFLGEAMQGKLDYQRIMGIPAFDPIKSDCRFLGCKCSS